MRLLTDAMTGAETVRTDVAKAGPDYDEMTLSILSRWHCAGYVTEQMTFGHFIEHL